MNPFTVLEVAPTLEVTAIKRAYFAALVKHPPHADAAGFRRIREAYELLLDSTKRTHAFTTHPAHAAVIEKEYAARFDGRVKAAVEAQSKQVLLRGTVLPWHQVCSVSFRG